MKIKVLKLGTECVERATQLTGMVTHWVINMSQDIEYQFQPKGLDEDGGPVQGMILEKDRLEVEETDFEEVEVPFEILGTQVEDKASGFTGMATRFIRHPNGCFHVDIQPSGMIKGSPIKAYNFDLRQCAGEKIVELGEEALAKSKEETPSPTGGNFSRRGFTK